MAAFPSLWRDSVVFWPIPFPQIQNSDASALPATYMQAVRRGRVSLTQFSERWVQRASESYAAHMGRALALELMGELGAGEAQPNVQRSAMMSLAEATRLSVTAGDTLDAMIASTRVQLRAANMIGAARTADAALRDARQRPPELAERLLPLAALLGRADVLAVLQRQSSRLRDEGADGLPDWLAERYALAIAAGAVNECAALSDKLSNLDRGLATHFSPNELAGMRVRWLAPAARLSLPCLGGAVAHSLNPALPMDRAVQAWASGDGRIARAILDSATHQRRGANASAVAWDVAYGESWLLTQLGDTTEALKRLEGSLNDLSGLSEAALRQLSPAVGLRNALRAAATLANARGNPTSGTRWSEMYRALDARRSP